MPEIRPKDPYLRESGIVLLFVFSFGSFFLWYRSHLEESSHRNIWALNRKRDAETLWQQEFVDTVFPIILRVRGDRIEPACSAFGVEVSTISDLLCRNDRGDFTPELVALVKEVAATRKTAKRSLHLRARGAEQYFFCSICVYYDMHSDSTFIGIEVRETWNPSLMHHEEVVWLLP